MIDEQLQPLADLRRGGVDHLHRVAKVRIEIESDEVGDPRVEVGRPKLGGVIGFVPGRIARTIATKYGQRGAGFSGRVRCSLGIETLSTALAIMRESLPPIALSTWMSTDWSGVTNDSFIGPGGPVAALSTGKCHRP
jgi:hypothetical protein